ERMRMEKIQANAAFLKSLGLEKKPFKQEKPKAKRSLPSDSTPSRRYLSRQCKVSKQEKSRRKRALPSDPTPSRRSLRRQCKDKAAEDSNLNTSTLKAENEDEIAQEIITEESYTDSNVLKYMCQSTKESHEPVKSSSLLFKTDELHDRFDAQLKKIYTMDSKYGLVASGGHLGYTSIYAQDTIAGGTAPLHSFRAHQGWISSVKILPPTATRSLFLTAANDAYVKIWDLNQTAKSTELPKLEVSTNDLHSNGIFSLDLQMANDQVKLLTCSKDQSVVLSILNNAGSIQRLDTFEDHLSVVKCVRFSPHDVNMFASCSNDRSVIVRDIRSKSNATIFSDVHTQAVNCVRWHPINETQLTTSSFDGSLHVFDTRKPSDPVVTFGLSKTTKLFNHEFIHNEYIAVCLEKTLTLYCTTTGTTFSKGAMEYAADSIMSPSPSTILVAHKSTISLFTAS
ncbi:hypothetical protein THRCLA_10465, partial [Thraustotheca clavata]